MDHSLGIKRSLTSFPSGAHVAKRSRFLENGIKNTEVKTESQPSKSDKVKAMAQASDLQSGEAESVKAQSRKSNDSPAVVPIKKRRFHIMEATRSPSPPPRSPTQQARSPRSIPSDSPPPCGEICTPVPSNSSLLGFSSASSPRSSVPVSTPSSLSQARLSPALCIQSFACVDGNLNGIEKTASPQIHKLDTHEQGLTNLEKGIDKQGNFLAQQGSTEDINEQAPLHTSRDQFRFQAKADGQLIRSESDSFSRDDRLHWDLNTDMAAWDASNEQCKIKVTEDKYSTVRPPRSRSVDSAGYNQKEGSVVCKEVVEKQLEEDSEYEEEESAGGKEIVEAYPEDRKETVEGEQDTGGEVIEDLEAGEHAEDDPEIRDKCEEESEKGEEVDEEPTTLEQDISESSECREIEKGDAIQTSGPVEGACHAPNAASDSLDPAKPGSWDADLSSDGRDVYDQSETLFHQDDVPERHKPGKPGKSSSDDAVGWNYEPELEEHVDYGDSDCRDADDPGADVDDRTSLMQAESNWNGEDGTRPQKDTEGEASITGEMLKPSFSRPTLELSPERQRSSGRSRTTGWDQLPEGFESAEEALKAAKEGSARRGGRGVSWNSPAGRSSLHSANRFVPSTIRSNTRDGFSSGRGESYYGERHPDEAMYERDGFRHGRRVEDNFSARGRDPLRRPGMFGRGRAGGWMDSQPSHMNQWGSGRHRPGSGFSGPSSAVAVSAARAENSAFVVVPDGMVTKHGMGPGRGGIRSTVSGGRVGRGGHARGPPVDIDGGAHYPLRAGAGADRVAGMGAGGGPGYSGSMQDRSGRGMMDRYRGGGVESRRSLSPRRQYPSDHPNMMGRMPGMRQDSRVVRSRTPPPVHRSMGFSDFNAVRNQRSPPPRWSSDKKEADSYQDRDFKRPLSRTRVPQRTPPHMVHGSSLTAERDHQVLAGGRQSSPLKSSVAATYFRKSKEDGLYSRPFRRSDEDDASYIAGSFAKDGDHRRSSPSRESDREWEKGSLYGRGRDKDDERTQDFRRSSSRDGRFPGGPKHLSAREADDDVAPRRRRPS